MKEKTLEMKMKFKCWIYKNYKILEKVFKLFSQIIMFLIGFLINAHSEEILKKINGNKMFFNIGVFLFLFLILAILMFIGEKIKKAIMSSLFTIQEKDLLNAFKSVNELEINLRHYIENKLATVNLENLNSLKRILIETKKYNIEEIIKKCYEFFQNTYGKEKGLSNEIEFEVNFMTKSYLDDEITISVSCNKKHLHPKSIAIRYRYEENNFDNQRVYEKTETAKIYENNSTCMTLISNTSDGKSGYVFLHENQENRIKSTIISPVLSNNSLVIGTIVVNSDQKNFFKEIDRKFWDDLISVFSVEIAKEKVILDKLLEKDKDSEEKDYNLLLFSSELNVLKNNHSDFKAIEKIIKNAKKMPVC